MNRPTGVTILAVLNFIFAALYALVGLGIIVGGGAIAAMMSQSNQAGAGGAAGMFAALGAAAGVVMLLFAGLCILIAIGLLKLKNWARITTIVLAALGIAGQLPGLFAMLTHFSVLGLLWTAFWVAIEVWIIMYLLKPEVKAAFQGGQVRAVSA